MNHPIGRKAPTQQHQIKYGHNGTQIVVLFPRPLPNLLMSPEQADAMIRELERGKRELAEYQAKQAAS